MSDPTHEPSTAEPGARRTARVAGRELGGGELFVIAGPCVLETRELALSIARQLAELSERVGTPLIFKASFDKANRTSRDSKRGPGIEDGLAWLEDVRRETGLPLLTDVHTQEQCAIAGEVVDVLQIPAFLCRQTDLLVAAAATGKAVNVKKGQFLAPWDMAHVARKVTAEGNPNVILTERGTTFGYGRLVVDMSGFAAMAQAGKPVVFDATHSVQEPGGASGTTSGDRSKVPALARAAVATGHVDGVFFEVHPDPESSPSDGPNMVRLEDFPVILGQLLRVHAAVRG